MLDAPILAHAGHHHTGTPGNTPIFNRFNAKQIKFHPHAWKCISGLSLRTLLIVPSSIF